MFRILRLLLLWVLLLCFVIFLLLALKTPQNDRDWLPDLTLLPGVTVTSPRTVSVAHVRNWTIEADGTQKEAYQKREFNVQDLERVWFFVEPLPTSPMVAHTFFSFDFKGQEPIVISIEARKEKSEAAYSALKGFFRAYELIYVWASEEDAIGRILKTSDRELYMYPLVISQEGAAQLFMGLAERSAHTEQYPEFYNTLSNNCTNILADVANEIKPSAVPWSFTRFITGYADEYLMTLGYIARESTERADIGALVRKTPNGDLSQTIRMEVLGG